MLYMIRALLKPGAEERLARLQDDFNEHLAQPFRRVRLAGTLRDGKGGRIGYLAMIEADSVDQAELYLRESPLFRADLYAQTEVLRYDVELGNVGG